MRRSNRFWASRCRPEGLHCRPDRRRLAFLFAWVILPLALALALATGCVTRGTFEEVEGERDALLEKSATLERDLRLARASNRSLSNERARLIDEIETLRTARAELTDSVAELEAERQRLATDLARRKDEVEASRQEVDSLRSTYDGLVEDLQREVSQGRIQIEQLREGLRVQLSQEVLFPVGSAELDREGQAILRKVVDRLRGLPHEIAVHGHTDDRPILGALAQVYPSNWELAGARAARVVRLFASEGIAPERLEAVSFGSVRPRASNETPEGRALNRRIELQLTPVGGAALPPEVAPLISPPTGDAPAATSEASDAATGAGIAAPPAGPPVRGEEPPRSLGPPVRGEQPPVSTPEAPGSSPSS